RCLPEQAFAAVPSLPFSLALAHHPDAFSHLLPYRPSLTLSGHLHGGQIALPLLRQHFVRMEQPRYYRGLFYEQGCYLCVSRGVGATLPFRFFSSPELCCLELVSR